MALEVSDEKSVISAKSMWSRMSFVRLVASARPRDEAG